jgi:hypothetical protein
MVYKLKFVWIGSSVKLDYPITKTVASFSYYIYKVIWKVTCTLLSMTSFVTDKDTNILLQDLEWVSDKLNTWVDFWQ